MLSFTRERERERFLPEAYLVEIVKWWRRREMRRQYNEDKHNYYCLHGRETDTTMFEYYTQARHVRDAIQHNSVWAGDSLRLEHHSTERHTDWDACGMDHTDRHTRWASPQDWAQCAHTICANDWNMRERQNAQRCTSKQCASCAMLSDQWICTEWCGTMLHSIQANQDGSHAWAQMLITLLPTKHKLEWICKLNNLDQCPSLLLCSTPGYRGVIRERVWDCRLWVKQPPIPCTHAAHFLSLGNPSWHGCVQHC